MVTRGLHKNAIVDWNVLVVVTTVAARALGFIPPIMLKRSPPWLHCCLFCFLVYLPTGELQNEKLSQ